MATHWHDYHCRGPQIDKYSGLPPATDLASYPRVYISINSAIKFTLAYLPPLYRLPPQAKARLANYAIQRAPRHPHRRIRRGGEEGEEEGNQVAATTTTEKDSQGFSRMCS